MKMGAMSALIVLLGGGLSLLPPLQSKRQAWWFYHTGAQGKQVCTGHGFSFLPNDRAYHGPYSPL